MIIIFFDVYQIFDPLRPPPLLDFLTTVPFGEVVVFGANVVPDLLVIGVVFELPDVLDEGGAGDEVVLGDDGDVAGDLGGGDGIGLCSEHHSGCVSKTLYI